MKNGLRHFRLACGVVGLLAVMTEASTPPTFSLNMAGIKKAGQGTVIFRDIACDPVNDQCEILAGPGSKCVDTEVQQIAQNWRNRCSPLDQVVSVRCVGGPTPGISCSTNNDCGFRGACRRLAVPASHCVGGLAEGALCTTSTECGSQGTCVQGSIVPLLCRDGLTPGEPCREDADCGTGGFCDASFVEPGDQIILEGFLHGWDDDLDAGACNVRPTFPSCDDDDPCTGRHCRIDLSVCRSDDDCILGQACVPNECLVAPLCGGFQWTIFSDRFGSLTSTNPHAALYAADIECATDADCRHGRDLGGSTFKCTCGDATCVPVTGNCTRNGVAYIDLARADWLYRELPAAEVDAGVAFGLYWESVTYFGSVSDAIVDPQQDEYAGTLWLQVPPQAAGTYKPGLDPGEDWTYVTDDYGVQLPGTIVVDLQIEVYNPCEDFDVETECDPPLNVCRVVECIALNGEPVCNQRELDCVGDEDLGQGYDCVIDEGGCVEVRACCQPEELGDRCRIRSNLECDDLGWVWHESQLRCTFANGQTVCREPPECPGPMNWAASVPPVDVLDARQPRDVNDGATLQGIDLIVVTGDAGADARCFSFCETRQEGAPNDIDDVVEDPDGTYSIYLTRRITPGTRTIITYDAGGDNMSVARFNSLPADVDAGQTSNAGDIVEMVECCLNQACTPAYGEYSCDLDHSGGVSGADVLRVIDLLHGAGDFTRAWDGEELIWGVPCE